MNIDIYLGGQFFHRWTIDELKDFVFDGSMIQDPVEYNAAFAMFVEAKEGLIKLAKEHFFEHTMPLLKTMKQVSVQIVFDSKMNSWPVDKDEEEYPVYDENLNEL